MVRAWFGRGWGEVGAMLGHGWGEVGACVLIGLEGGHAHAEGELHEAEELGQPEARHLAQLGRLARARDLVA